MNSNPAKWPPIQMSHYEKPRQTSDPEWIKSWISTQDSARPVVHSGLTCKDCWGFVRMRWGIGRMRYTVAPGLYGIGEPVPDSPVFVTANYKMTFDLLRRDLAGLNGWILVLDTHGINVWCAAGKGTFGTHELVNRIECTELHRIVTHRELIVPQLGAVGVAAHRVKEKTGFKVIYGPVYSKDIRSFIAQNKQCSDGMRQIRFTLRDRLVLIPLEWIPAMKYGLLMLPLFFIRSLIFDGSWSDGFLYDLLGFLGAVITGSVLVPLLLPWLPGRAFSSKGACLGLFYALIWSLAMNTAPVRWVANVLLYSSVSSYLALNFTGASTYTSMSGVYRELRLALPWILPSAITGLVLQWF